MKILFALLAIVFLWQPVEASESSSPTTNVTNNNTTIINDNAGSSVALAGAMGMHYFTRSTNLWQGSFSGACYEYSEHCALSVAAAKRQGDFLWALSISANDDDQMIGGSFGWTFGGK